jgi:hypothetical protein
MSSLTIPPDFVDFFVENTNTYKPSKKYTVVVKGKHIPLRGKTIWTRKSTMMRHLRSHIKYILSRHSCWGQNYNVTEDLVDKTLEDLLALKVLEIKEWTA